MRSLLALLVLSGAILPHAVHANPTGNVLTLQTLDRATNLATVEFGGSHNTLSIAQASPAVASSQNTIAVSVSGDRNGGGAAGALVPAPLLSGLPWGSLSQSGEGNSMSFSVTGSNNLLAAVQSGSSNSVSGSVAGSRNQAAVSQTGMSNVAAFSQVGQGNIVSITQRSW